MKIRHQTIEESAQDLLWGLFGADIPKHPSWRSQVEGAIGAERRHGAQEEQDRIVAGIEKILEGIEKGNNEFDYDRVVFVVKRILAGIRGPNFT